MLISLAGREETEKSREIETQRAKQNKKMTLATEHSICQTMDVEEHKPHGFWLWKMLPNWTCFSPTILSAVEKKILSFLKRPYRGFFVDIGPAIGDADKIWTIAMNTESKEVPLVMLHGLCSGVALWVMNLDALAKQRPVYAIDLPGFGRSSRPTFSTDAMICEKQFVKSVEEWRRAMNINSMVLLGHSMGGFIASSYALSYPDRVNHLILADPWGFQEKPKSMSQIPLKVRIVCYTLKPFNVLWGLRAVGPFGRWVVQKWSPDIMRKFSAAVQEDDTLMPQYIHQCNVQSPSGESAFRTMMVIFGLAKNPMIHRIKDLSSDIPITFIHGSHSWLDSTPGEQIRAERANSVVDIKVVDGADHHVYADKPEIFNQLVNEACAIQNKLRRDTTEADEEHEASSSPPQKDQLTDGEGETPLEEKTNCEKSESCALPS